ncbi:MAG TPA: hypothetical protein PK435_14680 [Thermoanaerobaculaceae bacterium]|nr:hypothetical protein [Thermoanaerobaculaceae bacterium]
MIKEEVCMETTAEGTREPKFRSPKRILVRFFQKSRDRWKEKYKAVKEELKKRSNEVADVRRSRQTWREKAEEAQAEVERLREQVKGLQEELQAEKTAREETEKKGAPTAS